LSIAAFPMAFDADHLEPLDHKYFERVKMKHFHCVLPTF